MPEISSLPAALRELGAPAMLQYGAYQLALRSGWLRLRTPRSGWEGQPAHVRGDLDAALQSRPPFTFDPDADLSSNLAQVLGGAAADLIRQADSVLEGSFPLFGGVPQPLGFPPAWNATPGAGKTLQADRHWSQYGLDGEVDWRTLWELSRMSWAILLGRAYRLRGDAKYWDGCWALLESWGAANPPNTGPQWISGQEVGLRILALAFAWYAFAPALRSQPERAAVVLEMVAAHASRIPPTLSYARAQRNNHLLSEAVGLFTAGALFPALRGARRWERLGRRWLGRALADQVFPDGGYIQHSINYQRMALGLGLWAHRLAETQGVPLPAGGTAALERLARNLAALVEPSTGKAPHLGHDDGSQPLPLSTGDHGDMRPVLQAAFRALFGRSAFPPGAWDELGTWLGLSAERGGAPAIAPPAQDFPDAGLYLLREQRSWAAVRCARFRSRPAHSDQLHLDLWRNGINLALDPGTYRYAAAEPWDNALARAAAHNGPLVSGQEPMQRAGRFLWLQWAQGRLLGRWRSASNGLEVLSAEHDGYQRRGWTPRRTVVRAGSELWLVVDELLGEGQQMLQVAWTLPDGQPQLAAAQLDLQQDDQAISLRLEPKEVELGLYRAGELHGGSAVIPEGRDRTLGWRSPTYADLQPALTLVAQLAGDLPLRLLSWWVLGGSHPGSLQVAWESPGSGTLPFSRLLWGEEEIRP